MRAYERARIPFEATAGSTRSPGERPDLENLTAGFLTN